MCVCVCVQCVYNIHYRSCHIDVLSIGQNRLVVINYRYYYHCALYVCGSKVLIMKSVYHRYRSASDLYAYLLLSCMLITAHDPWLFRELAKQKLG